MDWFALETSSQQISMAAGIDCKCLREVSREGNASTLIEPLYHELGIDLEKIKQCIIGKGPGSYNGLRVGYAFLKGLLCMAPLPVVEVPTPLILAAQAKDLTSTQDTLFLILNNARRQEIYGALVEVKKNLPFIQWECVGSEEAIFKKLPAHIDAVVSYDYKVGDLPLLNTRKWHWLSPNASVTASIAYQLKLAPKIHLSALEPHYVRAPVP